MKKFEINRKQYQSVRKMDHNQMQEHFGKIYEDGYKAGLKDASAKAELPNMTELEETLQAVKGVGSARAKVISDVVKEFFERKVAGLDETCT